MTPAGTSNELDAQNKWEENTHTHTHTLSAIIKYIAQPKAGIVYYRAVLLVVRVEFCEATPISLVNELKQSYMGGRRTETCVAPRHVDASRDFVLLSPNEQRGGGRCQTLSFVLFSLLGRPRAGLAIIVK